METIAVLGAGSWGTALAVHLATLGHEVRLWGRDDALVHSMTARRENAVYLPGVALPPLVEPSSDCGHVLSGAPLVVMAVPSHGLRSAIRAALPHLADGAILVSATKGLEEGSLARMSTVLSAEAGERHPVVVLSGPSFASEVARALPTAVLAASTDQDAVARVQDQFRGRAFRLYGSDDVTGVEMGGAMKNVIAIAAGIVEGQGLGHNAMAALITRGLVEISRLAVAAGGRRDTLAGLSGLGDLVLTCTGGLSRNHHVGIELGRGRPLKEILAGMKMVAEGVRTTHAALALGTRYGVELPITQKMDEVMWGGKDIRLAVEELMLRRQRPEAEPQGVA